MDCRKVMTEQLAFDFNTTPEALCAGKNLFTRKATDPRKRPYENGAAFLQVLCVNGIVVCNSPEESLLRALRQQYQDSNAAWFYELENIHRLDKLLLPYGHITSDLHQYYISGDTVQQKPDASGAVWYSGSELEQFRGDDRFGEALAFSAASPDELAVTIEQNGKILGMAGASSDSPKMWQIGINVDPAFRHGGVATRLVLLLRAELLRRGIAPFYGTAPSHSISQRVAFSAGFVPAWAELYTSKREE